MKHYQTRIKPIKQTHIKYKKHALSNTQLPLATTTTTITTTTTTTTTTTSTSRTPHHLSLYRGTKHAHVQFLIDDQRPIALRVATPLFPTSGLSLWGTPLSNLLPAACRFRGSHSPISYTSGLSLWGQSLPYFRYQRLFALGVATPLFPSSGHHNTALWV